METSGLTVITRTKELQDLFELNGLCLCCTEIQEFHYSHVPCNLFRMTFSLRKAHVLEIVFFDPKSVNMGCFNVGGTPKCIVKRRNVELKLNTVSIQADAVAYRKLDFDRNYPILFDLLPICNEQGGELIYPYNIDWRTILDEASVKG